jgi:hypothetical protein
MLLVIVVGLVFSNRTPLLSAAVVVSWWFQSQRMKATESSISNEVRLRGIPQFTVVIVTTIYVGVRPFFRANTTMAGSECVRNTSIEAQPRWKQVPKALQGETWQEMEPVRRMLHQRKYQKKHLL